MSLKAVVTAEELTGLPSAIQNEYTAREDGSHILDVTTIGSIELADVTPLRNALGHKKQELDGVREERDALKVRVTDGQASYDKLAATKGGKEEVDTMVAAQVVEIETKLKGDLAEAQKTIVQKDALVRKHVLEATASAAIAKHGGNAELLMPHILGRLKVEEKNGELGVVPIQTDGSPWMSQVSGSTETGTVDELVSGAEFKKSATFASCFKADRPDGGTGQNEPEKRSPVNNQNGNDQGNNNRKDPQQRLAEHRTNNPGSRRQNA